MLDVVTWKWKPVAGYRSSFPGEAVNVLQRMVARHYPRPHRFTCITDDPAGIDASAVRIIPIWDTYANVPNPSNARNPSCYRRLRAFSAEAAGLIGSRILSLDMDVVITGDLTGIFDRSEDFVIWGGGNVVPNKPDLYNWYNGSLWLLRAGSRQRVWTEFDPAHSPRRAHAAGCRGSDQGWIAHCLGPNEAKFSLTDGVYSYRNHVLPKGGELPDAARIVIFHGKHDPWDADVQQRHAWVRQHWR
jgi:hypothetical protein